jgi:phage N-6-adenine-methyltransferase
MAFVRACEARFGSFDLDLAASTENAKAPYFYTREEDTFTKDWGLGDRTQFLNPEFADIEPYVAKLAAECRHRRGLTLLLTPASIGCAWFSRHVLGKAVVLGLSPRLTFEGTTAPYPKDLMLSVYGFGLHGFDQWRWTE